MEAAAARLSDSYRAKGAAAARAAHSTADVAAYLAYRAPATYAAALDVLLRVRDQRPGWRPRSVLDVGAGPGVATWAALAVWPELERVTLVEVEPEMARAGRFIASAAASPTLGTANWVAGDATVPTAPAELVLLSYVLNELRESGVGPLASSLWARTEDTVVFLEPGTPEGYARVLRARDAVLAKGGFTIAPCPHDLPCPLAPGDWCHFGVRLPRAETHRAVKGVSRGFEDEKLSYAAISRTPGPRALARVIRPTQIRSGHVYLDLCEPQGVRRALVTRRDKEPYRRARKAAWGDALELDTPS
ncbi:MAG: small ribosomal subunit Rsm22 family protein [Gaiellaceae bacterium]